MIIKYHILFIFLFAQVTANLYSQPLESWLIAHYKLDGNALDASNWGNNGTIYGAIPTADRLGVQNQAFLFDGQNDYISIPNSVSLNPTIGITVAAWIKPINYTGTGNDPIVEKPYLSHNSPYYQYHLSIEGSYGLDPYTFGFNVSINHQYLGVNSNPLTWNSQQWYHVVGTYDGIKIKIFVNGIPGDSLNMPGLLDTYDTDLFIGKFGNRINHTPGTIDDVKIYNRGLSNKEILQLYNYEKPLELNLKINHDGNCLNKSVQFEYTGFNAFDSVKWNFGDNHISREKSPDHFYDKPGLYEVELNTYYHQEKYIIKKVIEISIIPEVFIGNDTTLCSGSSIVLDAGNAGASFLWNNNSTEKVISIAQPGTYSVNVVNSCGSSSDTITIRYSDFTKIYIPTDTLTCRNSVFNIIATGPENYSYIWNNNSEGKEYNFFANNDVSINLLVTDQNNCSELFQTNLKVKECLENIVIPNVFTPNGDGKNDFWVIENLDKYPNASIEVFNRWGELVYSSVGYKYPWDGFFSGKCLTSGCYFYVIILNTGKQSFTGPLMIYQ